MDFAASVNYLYSLGNEVSAMKLGLENIRTLLDALSKPHEKYLKVQVAGTNGKGSVCAFLNSICFEAGIKTGLYTSPHLISITERVKINGIDISEDEFAQHANLVRETAESLLAKGELEYRPTFFEQMTAIALVAFAEAKIDLAILETGLGGRLDATTAANAEIAAITRIDLDHQEYLGDTIEEIAGEKAGIIRLGSRVCIGRQNSSANAVILNRCKEYGIIPRTPDSASWRWNSGRADFDIPDFSYEEVEISLLGEHQFENAALAVLVAQELRLFFSIDDEQIHQGLSVALHPGRLEWIEYEHERILLDGAHNVAGAKALRDYLLRCEPDANIALVFGVMKEKDAEAIAEILFPIAKDVILTRPHNPRASDPLTLVTMAANLVGPDNVLVIPVLTDAIDTANQLVNDYPATKGAFACVTGSLYLVGEVKGILESQI